jgi:hypothetical protein
MMKYPSMRWLFAFVALLLTGSAQAQEQSVDPNAEPDSGGGRPPHKLININTPLLPQQGKLIFDFNVRPFGGQEENLSYYFLEAQYGLTDRLALVARGGGARRRVYTDSGFQIPKGGQEYELGARLRLPDWGSYQMTVEGSITFPNRLDNTGLFFGSQFVASRQLGSRTTLYFAPKAILGERTLVTLGGGVHYRLDNEWTLFGDIQGAIIGDNAIRVRDFNSVRQEVWGVGVRYAPQTLRGRASIDLGVTNGLGRTTNFSATSALSGNSAFFVNITFRN